MFEPSGYPYEHRCHIRSKFTLKFLSFWKFFLKNAKIPVNATKLCGNSVAIVAHTSPDITGQETVQSCFYLNVIYPPAVMISSSLNDFSRKKEAEKEETVLQKLEWCNLFRSPFVACGNVVVWAWVWTWEIRSPRRVSPVFLPWHLDSGCVLCTDHTHTQTHEAAYQSHPVASNMYSAV